MRYRYAIYCSGKATRVIKFYSNDLNKKKLQPTFIYYDGSDDEIFTKLGNLIGKSIVFVPVEKYLNRAKLTRIVNKDLMDLMKKYSIDYMFCFGNKIINREIVSKYTNKIINFHPSLLPSFKGINAIDQALNSSVQILGNTAHFIDESVDTGPIILQSVISRSAYVRYDSVLDIQISMLRKIWDWLENDQIKVFNNKVSIINNKNTDIFFS